jgi:hypothetical protein
MACTALPAFLLQLVNFLQRLHLLLVLRLQFGLQNAANCVEISSLAAHGTGNLRQVRSDHLQLALHTNAREHSSQQHDEQ